jgi:hypothetical protein
MTRAEMLAELQAELNIAASGGLLSDAQLLAYLAEGERRFCEQTGFFTDFYNFQVVTEVGATDYLIDERIIEIDGLFEEAANRWLGRTTEARRRQTPYSDRFPLTLSDETADTSYWQADREAGILTLSPTPTTVRTFKMRVWRYPLVALDHKTGAAYDGEPEIPYNFHRAPVEWACYKALNHHDMEMQDPVKADDHLAAFGRYAKEGAAAFRRLTNHEVLVAPDQAYRA